MRQDVSQQLASAGLLIEGAPEVGALVRCRVGGDKGSKKSGWYVLHEIQLDGGDRVLVGRYGNWREYGDQSLKVEFDGSALSEAERERLQQEQARLRERAELERRERAENAARRAARIAAKLPDSGSSRYLDRKKVKAFGLMFSRGSIVVPVRSVAGDLVGLQFIDGDGGKRFLTGTPKRGCFHLIGLPSPRAPLVVAEGYATAASIHMATGLAVACAFDAGNLLPVSQALHIQYPDIIIAADNDAETDGNPGVTWGREAALAVSGRLVWPLFQEGATGTDFNDLHVLSGLDAVRDQVQAAAAPASESDPAPPEQSSPRPSSDVGRPSIEQALERYSLTVPDAKVWDSHDRRLLKQAAVKALWGRELFEQWKEHEQRRTVEQSMVQVEAKAADLGGRGGIALALARYVYLYPTDSAWDRQLRDVVPLSGLRYAIADCFDDWLKHPNRQQINREDLVFDPTQRCDPQSTINMFRGLPLRPAGEIADCEHILQLTWHVVNKDRAVWDWFISWLAYPLQHVGAKMATAVLMHSETQGSGKSLLFDEVMQRIYGEYGATLGQHQLDSQYTDWRSQKLFCLFEEVFSRDQKYSHTGTLKHMVTGRTHRIEKKFVSGWEEANHMNAVFLSNEVQPFPVEPTDRRMLVIWPRSTLPVDIQTMALQEIHNGGIEAFYAWLLNWDLGDFHPHSKPPMNDEKERLIDFGRPGWDTFYREWERGDLDVPYCSCLATDLFKVYERWCSRRREHVLSHTKFSGLLATRCRRRRDVWYDIGLNRRKGIFFIVGTQPESKTQSEWLGECVSEFQKAMNNDVDDRYGAGMP